MALDPSQKISYYLPRLTQSEVDLNNPIVLDGNLVSYPTKSITAAYTATLVDQIILANATGGGITVTLPDATLIGTLNRQYTVKKTDSSANAITIATTASQTIDGASTQSLGTQYMDITVVSDGSNWQVMQSPSVQSGLPLTGGTLTGALTVNKASATAFQVGANGGTNPVFLVNSNTASVATGVSITGAAAGAGVAEQVISSGTNEALTIDAKGTGAIGINTLATNSGVVTLGNSTSKAGIIVNGPAYIRGATQVPIATGTITALGTVQNSTPTAAQLLGGFLTQTGATGAGTVTLPTGTQMSTAVTGVAVGDSFEVLFANLGGGFNLTITGATGTTVLGNAVVPSGKFANLQFVNTGANTWNIYCVVSA